MSNVCHQISANAVSDLTIASVVKVSWISGGADYEQLWLELEDLLCKSIHIDQTGLLVDVVWLGFEVDR